MSEPYDHRSESHCKGLPTNRQFGSFPPLVKSIAVGNARLAAYPCTVD